MPDEPAPSGMMGTLRTIAIGREPRRTFFRLGLIVFVALILILVLNFLFLPIRVTGPSMTPTFENGEINFINRLAYLNHEPERGDIVGIRMSGRHMMFVKRIVGLPGETVQFADGVIYVNGKRLLEPYLPEQQCDWESPPHQLGGRDYYVVGDNRSMPFELHEKGAADRQRILGKAVFSGHHNVKDK